MRRSLLLIALLAGSALADDAKDDDLSAGEADLASPKPTRSTWNETENRFFSFRVGGDFLYDAARYAQDDASATQLDLSKASGLRDLRLVAAGKLKFVPGLRYTIGYMYDGAENIWRFRQTGLMLDIPALHGYLFVGRTKEGISTIKIMVGYNGWTIERSAANDAFLPILGDGVKWIGNGFGNHLVYNLGLFADKLTPKQPYEKNDYVAAGRAIFLPLGTTVSNLLHLCVQARYGSSLGGTLQYKSKPESFLAQAQAVDTGKIPAQGSLIFSGEVYYQRSPLIFGLEWYGNQVFSHEKDNPFFHGGEAFVSWLVTGETKPYNTKEGFFESTIPKKAVFDGGVGAWELDLRVSYVDLDAKSVEGGKFWRITPMVSWFMSKNYRLMFEYGYSRLDRFGLVGGTQYFQTRLQLTFN